MLTLLDMTEYGIRRYGIRNTEYGVRGTGYGVRRYARSEWLFSVLKRRLSWFPVRHTPHYLWLCPVVDEKPKVRP